MPRWGGSGWVWVPPSWSSPWATAGPGRSRGEAHVDARPGQVVDTVGAVDAFTAGLLAALSERDLLSAANRAALRDVDRDALTAILRKAAHVAALTCEMLTCTADRDRPAGVIGKGFRQDRLDSAPILDGTR
ncbi:PfkB family carbohydrate kinase [Micromonospora sp. NPDC005257]